MFESSWSIISAFIVFLLGLIIIGKISDYFGLKKKRSLLLYLWHTLFCFAYFYYVSTFGGDALAYYSKALSDGFEFRVGTTAVVLLTKVLVHGLGFGVIT